MKRREFFGSMAGAAAFYGAMRVTPHSTRRTVSAQSPALGPEVFNRRLARVQQELNTQKVDLLVVEPSTNFQYFAGYNPGRSERLILLMIPVTGAPVVVCPSFEVERLKRNSVVSDVRGWEEQEDPWRVVRAAGQQLKPARRGGICGVEPSTSYLSFLRLTSALGSWKLVNGAPVTERLRIVKGPEEIGRASCREKSVDLGGRRVGEK